METFTYPTSEARFDAYVDDMAKAALPALIAKSNVMGIFEDAKAQTQTLAAICETAYDIGLRMAEAKQNAFARPELKS